MNTLALTYDPDFTSTKPEVYLCIPAMKQRLVENAGTAFFDKFERIKGIKIQDETTTSPSSEADSAEPNSRNKKKQEKKSKTQSNRTKFTALKIIDALKDECLFGILGVTEDTSSDEIKDSYRSLVLAHHPDKKAAKLAQEGDVNDEKKKEIELHFIKIQESYNILSDEDKRRKYISTLEFNDNIPSTKARTNDEFFTVYTKAFDKFARWSEKLPVAHLGNMDTPYEEVENFYDFWGRFQSWRDPLEMLAKDEEELHDVEDAESREERRWMERENMRMAKCYKKQEMENIGEMVRRAEAADPRIKAEKERRKNLRNADKNKKAAEEKRAAVEKALEEKRLADEAAAAEAAAKEQRAKEKAEKEAAKQLVREARKAVRTAVAAKCADFVLTDQLNDLVIELTKEELTQLAADINSSGKATGKDAESCPAAQVVYESMKSKNMTPVVPEIVEVEEIVVELTPEEKAELAEQEKLFEQRRLKREETLRIQAEKDAEEKAKKDAEKAKKDAKARAAKAQEVARKQAERAKAQKKEEERKKKEDEKGAAKKAKAEADAQAKLDAVKAKQQQQSAAAQAERSAEENEKIGELRAQQFSTWREAHFEILGEADEEELKKQLVAKCKECDMLAGALAMLRRSKTSKKTDEDLEEIFDKALAVMGACGLGAMTCGINTPADIKAFPNVRNKSKKVRPRIRAVAQMAIVDEDGDKKLGLDVNKHVKDSHAAAIVSGECPTILLGEFIWTKGQGVHVPSATAAKAENTQESATGGKKKKKGKAKAADDEDLDALLGEFGIEVKETKKKKKKK